MRRALPAFTASVFASRLRELSPCGLSDSTVISLFDHYTELRRWNPRLSLVGPGTTAEVLSRHYGESLAALPLIEADDGKLVDLGSGGGFPGLVLAAARPRLEVTLVEARLRKWVFLRSACRRSGLSCRCLNARVERPLPEGFPARIDVVTSRALAIDQEILEALLESSPEVRFLLWLGGSGPRLPQGLVVSREVTLGGSENRKILEIRREN